MLRIGRAHVQLNATIGGGAYPDVHKHDRDFSMSSVGSLEVSSLKNFRARNIVRAEVVDGNAINSMMDTSTTLQYSFHCRAGVSLRLGNPVLSPMHAAGMQAR